MIGRKMLITRYDYSYFLVTQQIEGITHQNSMEQPLQGGNSLNRILEHISLPAAMSWPEWLNLHPPDQTLVLSTIQFP